MMNETPYFDGDDVFEREILCDKENRKSLLSLTDYGHPMKA